MKETHGSEMHAPPAMGAAVAAGWRTASTPVVAAFREVATQAPGAAGQARGHPSSGLARSLSRDRGHPGHPVRCPSPSPLGSAGRTSATAPAAREPGTRVTIHDSNTRPPSRPTRAPGPPDSDVALNTHDLATADTDRAPAASRMVRPVMVEIFGLRRALRRNRSPTHHKDPFPLISLLPRPFLLREQSCLRRVR
jgi:hypothetical protein